MEIYSDPDGTDPKGASPISVFKNVSLELIHEPLEVNDRSASREPGRSESIMMDTFGFLSRPSCL